jgi:hypothetical protein
MSEGVSSDSRVSSMGIDQVHVEEPDLRTRSHSKVDEEAVSD